MSTDPDSNQRMNRPRGPSPAPPAPAARPACPAPTRAGRPCRATPGADGWCCNHSPRFTAEDRSNWGKRGALANVRKHVITQLAQRDDEIKALAATTPAELVPSYETPGKVREYLERMTARVASNAMAPSQAAAVAQLAALGLKTLELEVEKMLLDRELARAAPSFNGRVIRMA